MSRPCLVFLTIRPCPVAPYAPEAYTLAKRIRQPYETIAPTLIPPIPNAEPPSVPEPVGADETAVCLISGKTYPKREMIRYQSQWVALEHREEFFRRIREGEVMPRETEQLLPRFKRVINAANLAIGEAIGGLRHLTAHPGGTTEMPPPRCGISISDDLAGMYAAIGLLSAVWQRDAMGTAKGRVRKKFMPWSTIRMVVT